MANEFRIKNGAISPNMVITDTTVSTSTATGALQVSGGAGIVGNVYAGAFYGAATGLTSIPGANVSGAVPSATVAATVTTAAQPNITSVGSNLTVSSGTGRINIQSTDSSIAIGRIDGVASSPYINFYSGASLSGYDARIICSGGNGVTGSGNLDITTGQVRITGTAPATSTTTGSLKTSGGLGVAGNVYAGAFYGPGTGLTSIPGANVSGSVPSATVAATVTTAAQPNVTSLGTLTGLTSSGVVYVTNTTVSTSKTSGAIQISGGVGVTGNVWATAVFCSGTTTGYASIIGNASTLTLGRIDNVASAPQIDFNSSATSVDYDARITCSGGNGTNGHGILTAVCDAFESSGKIGYSYAYGIGSSVTQLTSRTTGVTINALTGRITLVSATTTAGQVSTFTVTNSFMAASDIVYFTQVSGSGHYIITPKSTAAGSFSVNVYTPTAVSSAEAPAFNFAIIRGSLS